MAIEEAEEDEITKAIRKAIITLRYTGALLESGKGSVFLRGLDVFVCLPTGSGKSLHYSLLLLLCDHLRDSNGGSIIDD